MGQSNYHMKWLAISEDLSEDGAEAGTARYTTCGHKASQTDITHRIAWTEREAGVERERALDSDLH